MNSLVSNLVSVAGSAAGARISSALLPQGAAARAATVATTTTGKTATVGASTITSSDFLTLLVSELKNQDPTQPTDPNAYVQQLVGVNSLQQLIQINQGLTTIEPTGVTTAA